MLFQYQNDWVFFLRLSSSAGGRLPPARVRHRCSALPLQMGTRQFPNQTPVLKSAVIPRLLLLMLIVLCIYFVCIVQCGYEYEQTYAFLPLLPACISLVSHRAVLGLCGYVVSNVAFLFAAVYFYRLAVVMLKDPEAAFRASVLFCFNPASIFYSSIWGYVLLNIWCEEY
ncbi:hypothetical protein LWI28_022618 [Acer negundo]|uniref:GPI mannosyltransferase 2 n=1 Tax=Acer negundo TaxID=4023 RepID=A0AAD5JG69_ACENE|nr:hypothetical protein LWI28_022618 [Acer negundo]